MPLFGFPWTTFKARELLDTDIYQRGYIFHELCDCFFNELRLASIEIYRLYLLDHHETRQRR
jgi:hypothetical protein